MATFTSYGMPYRQLSEIPIAVASPSLGMNIVHTLPIKIKAAAEAKFAAIEIGMDDLIAYSRSLNPDLTPPHAKYHSTGAPTLEPDPRDPADDPLWSTLTSTALLVKSLCSELGLHVLTLHPLSQYEGWPEHTDRHAWAWEKALRWLDVASSLGAEMIQVGSNNELNASAGVDACAKDMLRLAQAAQERGVRVAYEPWCWGAYVNTWEGCWEIVQKANHPNLGLCLDTFQISGSPVYGASPTHPSGWILGYHPSVFTLSLHKLTESIPASKIFFLQISDGARLDPPLGRGNELDERWKGGWEPRQVWSAARRPLPFEDRGYLPVLEVVEAVLGTGFRGYFSYEPFEQEQEALDALIPDRYAQACRRAHEQLVAAVERKWRR
ncbi:xylose isomerase-like protein [Dacryopinax primogenitus]|uniref:Xylose isomerase-like protein n=1 Tax=Dacryopinax primogenitus (strain DJM 731) TaxID=1858805 RepID=M5G2V6_DACPD|nr:xylose isomerase-like protein [Dacryopinax primogenitus]EJU03029.1 xylose isomerase-like protein [Dacryopinax primogenitus]